MGNNPMMAMMMMNMMNMQLAFLKRFELLLLLPELEN